MATMMMMPSAAPAPVAPSSASLRSLLPRHQTNPNPSPNPNTTSNNNHHQLYVGNIPWDATEEEIIKECSIFGRVVSFKLVRDKETGKHKGYGFINFADEESALCAKRNQKGLLCRGRQLKVCDPISNRKDNHNNNKRQQQQKPQPTQNSQATAAVHVNNCPPSHSFPLKRPHEEVEADAEQQGSAHKRFHIDIPLSHTSHEAYDGKSQSAADVLPHPPQKADDKKSQSEVHFLDSGCPPLNSKRSHEASADEELEASATKRPRMNHVQLPSFVLHQSESDYVEPYSPTSPGFVWPRNRRNMVDQEGLNSHDDKSQQQMKPPTIIDHIDVASALSCAAAAAGGDLLVTDQGFINDLLNLSSLLRSACI